MSLIEFDYYSKRGHSWIAWSFGFNVSLVLIKSAFSLTTGSRAVSPQSGGSLSCLNSKICLLYVINCCKMLKPWLILYTCKTSSSDCCTPVKINCCLLKSNISCYGNARYDWRTDTVRKSDTSVAHSQLLTFCTMHRVVYWGDFDSKHKSSVLTDVY